LNQRRIKQVNKQQQKAGEKHAFVQGVWLIAVEVEHLREEKGIKTIYITGK